uniref:hypothetical protein n=1 Tax=Parolsenella massiliensis TaxID=1871022 RepID=UPI000932BD9B|nr:hypothetical protein [Parolsenella massiliensis]
MATLLVALFFLFLLSLFLSLVISVVGMAFGLVGLAFKLLPAIAVILVGLFFAQGGRVRRGQDGNVTLELPSSWQRRK